MFLNLKKTLFLVGSSALLFSACGDDGGGDPVDAAPIVIDADTTDAMPSTAFSGTVSLAEIVVTNTEAAGVGGISGAAAVVSFTAPADAIAPHPDFTNNVGECKVTIIDLENGDVEQGSDGGNVTVKGTAAGDFTCAYNSTADKYLCSTDDAAAAGVMPLTGTALKANGSPAGSMTVTIPGIDFSNQDYRGMQVILAGFNDAAGNGRFHILASSSTPTIGGLVNDDELLLVNSQALSGNTDLAAVSGYQTLVGAGPIVSGYDFLDDGTNAITIDKAAATDSVALAGSLAASGEGFTLSTASVKAHQFPVSGSGDAVFSCEGAGGTCGPDGAGTGVILHGLIVFGETTDGVLDVNSFSDMPDPVKKFATFQCTGINLKTMTIPSAAIDLINGTGHTRIQTSVTYASAQITPAANVVVSHGDLGFTNAP